MILNLTQNYVNVKKFIKSTQRLKIPQRPS